MTVKLIEGSAVEQLKLLPEESVHCVVTSPPYWGLRAYGGDSGMIGMEPTFQEHLDNLVEVFTEVKRVLRADGTLWLNYGDAYTKAQGVWPDGSPRLPIVPTMTYKKPSEKSRPDEPSSWSSRHQKGMRATRDNAQSWKPKDLMMMPARVAIALQEDGWWLRSEIIWHKPNPMPESAKDRPSSAHEKMFLLTKSARYFYDAVAVRTKRTINSIARDYREKGGRRAHPEEDMSRRKKHRPELLKNNTSMGLAKEEQMASGANLRNVWTIPVRGLKDAHFATFPPALIEPCIKAGTSELGCCYECGAPWERLLKKELRPTRKAAKRNVIDERDSKADSNSAGNNRQKDGHIPGWANEYETHGWQSTCKCSVIDEPPPCVVLDPFAGSGTTGMVADRLGRDSILIEINSEYMEMAKKRINQDCPLFADIE